MKKQVSTLILTALVFVTGLAFGQRNMDENVYWTLQISNSGDLETFTTLMNDMVAATRANEPNTLNYEWSVTEDGETFYIFERYTDSAAVMTHLANFGENFAERFNAIAVPKSLIVYGNPSDEVKEAIAGFAPVYVETFGGFAR